MNEVNIMTEPTTKIGNFIVDAIHALYEVPENPTCGFMVEKEEEEINNEIISKVREMMETSDDSCTEDIIATNIPLYLFISASTEPNKTLCRLM